MNWSEYLKSLYTGFIGGIVVSIFTLEPDHGYISIFSFKFFYLIILASFFVLTGAFIFNLIDRYAKK